MANPTKKKYKGKDYPIQKGKKGGRYIELKKKVTKTNKRTGKTTKVPVRIYLGKNVASMDPKKPKFTFQKMSPSGLAKKAQKLKRKGTGKSAIMKKVAMYRWKGVPKSVRSAWFKAMWARRKKVYKPFGTWKGMNRKIQKGARGGKYYETANGRKVYVKYDVRRPHRNGKPGAHYVVKDKNTVDHRKK